jgi:hypothetical protein
MLMVLGLFVFERRTLPYQSMQYSKDYRWASNDRIGKPPAYQYLGKGNHAHAVGRALSRNYRRTSVTDRHRADGRRGARVAAD